MATRELWRCYGSFFPTKQWHKSNHAYLLEIHFTLHATTCVLPAHSFIHKDAFKDLF